MIRKYSATLHGHRTSFSLEEAFFNALKNMAEERGLSLAALIAEVDDARGGGNLSSALRLHVLAYYQDKAAGPLMEQTAAAAARP